MNYVNAIICVVLAAAAVQDVRNSHWRYAMVSATLAAFNGWAATV